jgi:hypothetical protein
MCACWPSAPSLIHVDQRQRTLRWSVERDEQLQQRASKVQPPMRGLRIFIRRVLDRNVLRIESVR